MAAGISAALRPAGPGSLQVSCRAPCSNRWRWGIGPRTSTAARGQGCHRGPWGAGPGSTCSARF